MTSGTRFLLAAATLLATLPPGDGQAEPGAADGWLFPLSPLHAWEDSDDASTSTSGWETSGVLSSAPDAESSDLESSDLEGRSGTGFAEHYDQDLDAPPDDSALYADDDAGQGYCFPDEAGPHAGLATMTPYSWARAHNLSAAKVTPEGCRPVQLWHLIRHGSRSMHRMDLMKIETQLPLLQKKILAAHSLGNGELCTQDLALIRGWKLRDMDKGKAGTLTPEGRAEVEGIASRFKAAFPDLVYKRYSISKTAAENVRQQPGEGTKIAYAPSRQTYESAVTYLEALYGRQWGHVGLSVTGSQSLQYFRYCKNYINKVMALNKKRKPFHIFTKGTFMEGVMGRVSRRTGVIINLTKLRTMYNACRYQKAWAPQDPSPWCVVFTPSDLQVLEYWEDLRVYHDHGYAHPVTYKQACVLGTDMLTHFRERTEHGISDTDSTAYFVNVEAFVPFMALLGLFKDSEPLTSEAVNMDRVWKTSKFAGYGSNFGLLLSSCGSNSVGANWWVTAILNEEKIKLPGCETSLGCPWERFVSEYDFLEDCDFPRLCKQRSYKMCPSQNWHLTYIMNNWM
ncbi:multiple inositol polyphosphate phosphatase 1-like [Penaeus monodon]|uniref:multiple inositol polyphosphate phosphatase 1-like n=1 Tax=Penaeus monodon TaxID=6687 RepID=UPI0018A75A1C|nr:multiple inositol polyphosphate phosphatase 1-like [Penaeus monodon]XP_037777585.1 multiple inositol polyphosphate phosphatase 1-like [Penaeus monodon]